ncbi:dTDP-4-dehydrorhamnose reductase [Caballeronia novacaledonica]|uniref:dTDP-4-dehydrorhamnose reductase n=1 Tax=Caballeronia novacaledonica TaxID=1544861 RepID=UPI001EE2CD71|nr:dTDP-4-dehydrorhamnose reductase [Caballeronia novacaledonica]GJH09262.1 dTDP-4-dehydrorhamnose reductase [Caballeronia novacaledonica]
MSNDERAVPVILITGAGGQVGAELTRSMSLLGRVVAVTRSECDLARSEQVESLVREVRPDVILNAGGYTEVDRAESDSMTAHRVNADAPGILARAASELDALMVHYSTDYVFSGDKATAYTEEDEPNPLSVYGESKLAGERAVTEAGGKHYIFRTSWVFGLRGTNFLKSIARAAQTRDSLSVVADQFGAPTSAALVADVTALAVRAYLRNDRPLADGIYHLTASGETNWYDYSRLIVDTLASGGVPMRTAGDAIQRIGAADYPTAARRPANSRLDTSKLRNALEVEFAPWEAGVRDVLLQIAASKDVLR